MIKLETIEFPGLDYISNNIDMCAKMFLENAVIAFRNAHCDRNTQEKVMQIFGDRLDWWPNSSVPELKSVSNYEETHELHMNLENKNNKDALMLGWHLEHVQLKEDIYVGANWCMNLFRCDPDAGKTYFVDMLALYDSLSNDYKEFLEGVDVLLTSYWGAHQKEKNFPPAVYRLVQKHWILDRNVLRVFLGSINDVKLYKIYGKDPSEDDLKKFNEVMKYIYDEVTKNTDIRFVHYWQEGDMVISDMFRMAHAVTGGFKEGERKLDGIFGKLRIANE